MTEVKFPMEFNSCPSCHCPDTLARLAWENEIAEGRVGESSKDMFVSARKEAVPLIDPKRGIQITARLLLRHFDTCAKCGTERCIRAEIVSGQVQMGGPGRLPGKNTFGFPPGGGPTNLS